MNEEEFNKLDMDYRLEIINEHADFISVIKHFGFNICLYSFSGAYIEVFYNAHSNAIEDIAFIESTDNRMNLYAARVDISGLLK